jgi:dipeptidyl aminopeptidase/acylaminoacyl peptidase
VGLKDLVTGRRVFLPANRFASELGAPQALGRIALGGDRVLYALYEAQGNTEEHFFLVSTALRDRNERLADSWDEYNRPYAEGDGPLPPPIAADGRTLLYIREGRLFRLRGHRRAYVQSRPLGPWLAASGSRYSSAWLTSRGGCICNLMPNWSPDGTKIAFMSGVQLVSGFEPTPSARIQIVDAAGGASRSIARGGDPDWSPDGTLIAYVRRLAAPEIWVIQPDGTGARRLLAGAEPDWHPDGTRLAFVRNHMIHVASRSGSDVRPVTRGVAPAWSPDGRRLAYVFEGEIYVANADGSGSTRLTRRPELGSEASVLDPAWSPDGRQIAYTNYVLPYAAGRITESTVSVMNADGSGKRTLEVGRGAMPAWSPDGVRVGYARWLERPHPALGYPSTEIFTAALDGSGQRRVTATSPPEPRSAGFVRSLGLRKRTAALKLVGVVRGLALTPSFAAVLSEGFAGKHVVLLHPRTGRVLRRVALPDSARELSAARRSVVFLVGREIKLLRAGRPVTTIAGASVTPRGLSIEGRRVAWIENRGRSGRIRGLTLPQ